MTTIEGSYISKLTGSAVPYLLHKPKDYSATKSYPLIISMTGDGEKIDKGINALRNSGMNNTIINKGLEIPFCVFSPQCGWQNYDNIGPNGDYRPGEFASEAVDQAAKLATIDLKKVILAGLSMSAISVYLGLAYFPNKFAAGISSAGWEPDLKEAYKIIAPVWKIQSENDPVSNNVDYGSLFLSQTKSKNNKQTLIASSGGHYIWDPVYSNDWINMPTSSRYPNLDKPSNIYNWAIQFSTDGVVTPPIEPPVVDPPVVPPVVPPIVPIITNSNMTIKDSTGKVLLGKIEAENYTATNKKGTFTENTTDENGGKNVGWSNVNDYLDYAINIPVDGVYQIDLRVATIKDAQIKVSSGTSSNVISALNSNGWQNWKTVSTQLKLVAGPQTIRITALSDGFNLNWINVSLYSITVNGYLVTE